ncbi:MAG: DUF5320 domain-containing protein [Firmicutes bacterium]|jgi:hypothetical protein|nr:DUF5320 domain-containing protein [Bacillota bacterium]
MPRGDATGPMGYGPMTGRGAGYCAGFGVPGYMNPGWGWPRRGMGFGWRRGRGRGWRHMYYAAGAPGWARQPHPGFWAPAAYQPAPAPAAYPGPAPVAYEGDVQDEIAFLRQQAEILEQELAGIEERLEELGKHNRDDNKDD